jgi:hypothetical protein
MSKRKRASLGKTTPESEQTAGSAGEESREDASKEDMVHVTPDLLAGSPDIFSSKRKDSAATEPEVVTEPVRTEIEASSATSAEEVPAPAPEPTPVVREPVVHEPAATPVAITAPEPPRTPPPPPAPPRPMRRSSSGSSVALGIVLVVVGLFALLVSFAGVDLTQYGWPLFVIIPGLTLLIVGFLGVGQGASIPGGVVTVLGLLLAYQSSTGDWATWAFAWALVAPGGVGLGMYLQALRDRDTMALRTGRSLMFIAVLIFMIGFVLFESILGISGRDYGFFGKAALPILLIVIGIILLWRQRARRA